jgi:antitoxin component of RelBE/YafQ-DinJ toxin-antitoxin module
VRLFLRRVVIDQAFPLELKVPNAQTLAAMEESRAMMAKCHVVDVNYLDRSATTIVAGGSGE